MKASKMKTLARLADVYALIEVQKAALLSRSNSALRAVERKLEEQTDLMVHMRATGSKALVQGERSEWLMCESERECATRNVTDLERANKHRQEMRESALEQYLGSLLKKDQMDAAVDVAKSSLREAQQRREQISLDDRFVARSNWIRAKEQRRVNLS